MLEAEARWARDWLFEAALPLWWNVGADPAGGFCEKITLTGEPVMAARRLRVQARQAYAYMEAGRLGWEGPWREAARHGLDFLLARFCRPDGLFRALVTTDGTVLDDSADLYDQAFVLFALAHAHSAGLGGADFAGKAGTLMAALKADRGHPIAGFEEGNPRILPLRSNPHMHLLEATLAWLAAGVRDPFEQVADAIAQLAVTRLIDPATGAIGEYYDEDWAFVADASGGVREPGHQFEWACLLDLAGPELGRDYHAPSRRLYEFGTRFGIDPDRKVAVFCVNAQGAVTDPKARLWAQTERLRTALVFAAAEVDAVRRDAYVVAAGEAFRVVQRYLDVPVRGLWHEWCLADGSFAEEAAPASSFYHLISAFTVLLKAGGAV